MKPIVHGSFPVAKPPVFSTPEQAPQIPVLPSAWECAALLHPYSPPPLNDPRPNTPFFQLCIASISFIAGQIFSIQVTGLEYGTWWYKITPTGTTLSTDQGRTWQGVSMGWTLPTMQWLTQNPTFFSTSYLNWMQAQEVDWWKQAVPNSNATTWIWYDHRTSLPFRMMFGAPPPSPTRGDPNQLAFFQNFSFTYFPSFVPKANPNISVWLPPVIPGFQAGNPLNQKLVVWNDCFGMTTFMTPVDSKSFPLPTVVLYQWKPDNDYRITTDRSQLTVMSYEYNPSAGYQCQVALLYGVAPSGVSPPPNAGDGYIFNETFFLVRGYPTPIVWSCQNIGLGQEPPTWARIPGVQGRIHAYISNNTALCPGQAVDIISVLFPPSKEYPQGRYLWTWYSPFLGSDGTHSRPVTFMESASTIAEGGTSLALADYFEYFESPTWFPPDFFQLPPICATAPPPAEAKP